MSRMGICLSLVLALSFLSISRNGISQTPPSSQPSPGSTPSEPPQPSPDPSPVLLPPRQDPITQVATANGKVSVRLINQTGNPLAYIAIGDTDQRTLAPNQTVLLKDLNLPVNLNAYYSDQQTFEKTSLLADLTPDNKTRTLTVTFKQGSQPQGNPLAVRIGRRGNVYRY